MSTRAAPLGAGGKRAAPGHPNVAWVVAILRASDGLGEAVLEVEPLVLVTAATEQRRRRRRERRRGERREVRRSEAGVLEIGGEEEEGVVVDRVRGDALRAGVDFAVHGSRGL